MKRHPWLKIPILLILCAAAGSSRAADPNEFPQPATMASGVIETESGPRHFLFYSGCSDDKNIHKIFGKTWGATTLYHDSRRLKCYEAAVRIAVQMPAAAAGTEGRKRSLAVLGDLEAAAGPTTDIVEVVGNLKTNYVSGANRAGKIGNWISKHLRKINPKYGGNPLKATNLQRLGKVLSLVGTGLTLSDFAIGASLQQALAGDAALARLDHLEKILRARVAANRPVDPLVFEAIEKTRKKLARDEAYWGALLTELDDRRGDVAGLGVSVVLNQAHGALKAAMSGYLKNHAGLGAKAAATKAGTLASLYTISITATILTTLALFDQHKKAQIGVTAATLAGNLREERRELEAAGGTDELLAAMQAQAESVYYSQMVSAWSGALGLVAAFKSKVTGKGDLGLLKDYFRSLDGQAKARVIEHLKRVKYEFEKVQSSDLQLMLCIDTSSSMRRGKIEAARRAAHTLLGYLRAGDRAGLVPFASDVRHAGSLTLLDAPGAALSSLRRLVAGLQANGGTNFTAPLAHAYRELASGGSGRKAVLFLSDGQANYPAPQVEALRRAGIPVFAVAIGGDAARDILSKIATATGGALLSSDVKGLQQAFDLIGGRARGASDLLVKRGLLFPQEKLLIPITLPGPRPELTFMLSWPGSDIGLTVTRPDGTRLDAASARKLSGVGFTYDPVAHTRTARIRPAPAGRWSVTLTGKDVQPTGEFFTLTATQALDAPVHIVPFDPKYGVSQPVPLAVSVPPEVRDGCRVTATVTDGDGNRHSLDLSDDGRDGDATPADGIFSTTFRDAKKAGFYQVRYNVRPPPAQSSAAAEIDTTFQVGPIDVIRRDLASRPRTPVVVSKGGGGGSGSTRGDLVSVWRWAVIAVLLCLCLAVGSVALLYSQRRGTATAARAAARAPRLLIGRSPACGLVLEGEQVSREHAVLERHGDRAILRDLDSANGLWVNGESVTVAEIRAGDVVEFGDEAVTGEALLARLQMRP